MRFKDDSGCGAGAILRHRGVQHSVSGLLNLLV
jgi:hypothetical protein